MSSGGAIASDSDIHASKFVGEKGRGDGGVPRLSGHDCTLQPRTTARSETSQRPRHRYQSVPQFRNTLTDAPQAITRYG